MESQALNVPFKRELTEKEAILVELNGDFAGTRPVILFKKLLQVMIDEARVHNDEVPLEHLQLNQGKISVCKQLLDYFNRKLPA